LDINSGSIYIARFVSTRDDDGDTNDAARTRDDDTGGGRGKGDRRRRLFVFVKVFFFFFFFFVVVVYVVVFRDWIFGYERRWLSLSMMISFRLDAQRAWHDLTFLFLSLSLSGIDDTAEIFVQTRVLVPRDRVPNGGEETGVPREGQMFCVESGK
jgi:hypothetical protein